MSQPPDGSGEARVRTFVMLYEAARVSLKEAKAGPVDRHVHCLHCLVDAAFAFEAYLNHLGPSLIPFWKNVSRLKWRDKLAITLSHLNLSPDHSRRPFRSVGAAFAARNLAAHASTERMRFMGRLKRDGEDFPVRPQTKLEKMCSLRNAEKVVEEVGEAIEEMHKASGNSGEGLWWNSETEWSSVSEEMT